MDISGEFLCGIRLSTVAAMRIVLYSLYVFTYPSSRMRRSAFTLVELLIVIAIIAVLAVVVFVTLDPLTRFRDARDSQRWSDVTAMLDAAKLDQVDRDGSYLGTIAGLTAGSYYVVGTCASGADTTCTARTTQAACADLEGLVTAGKIPGVPRDPSTGTAANTDYFIMRTATGALTMGACDPENTPGGILVQR